MAEGSTARFLQFINDANARMAARKAEEEAPKGGGVDPIQIQRDQERRERLGQLRARPHNRSKTARVRSRWDTLGSSD